MSGQLQNFFHIVGSRINYDQTANPHVPDRSGGGPDIFGIAGPIQNNADIIQIYFRDHSPVISNWLKK
jgi:hypothetical protein